MTIARSIASPIARSIASPLDGAGGGGAAPDPYGPELLVNPSFAGYVAGSPGTPPTGWLNLQTDGSLADPSLTFGVVAGRRAIYQNVAVTAGTYRFEVDVTLNSGADPAVWVTIFYAAPPGTTIKYFFIGDAEVAGGATWNGTKKLAIEFTVINIGNIQPQIGSGVSGARTMNVTHSNPSLKKLL
jgi:hypothetical protein